MNIPKAQSPVSLLRIIAGAATTAILGQVAAHQGIQAWFEGQLFAASATAPESIQVGPQVWAAKAGAVSLAASSDIASLTHAASQYEFFAGAIAWTMAAGAAALFLRYGQRPESMAGIPCMVRTTSGASTR